MNANLVISNDDGFRAEGIQTLYKYLNEVESCFILAPHEERSTTGHSLSLDRPLRLYQHAENMYSCDGYPADCVLLAIAHLCKAKRPKMVVSGVNRGANLGQDLFYSGTVAAAREAAFHGVRSIAISLSLTQVTRAFYYETAALFAQKLVKGGICNLIPEFVLLNINVPNLTVDKIKGVRWTEVGFRHYSEEVHAKVDSRGRDYYWIAGALKGHDRDPKSECVAVEEGYISVTPHVLIDRNQDLSPVKKMIEQISW